MINKNDINFDACPVYTVYDYEGETLQEIVSELHGEVEEIKKGINFWENINLSINDDGYLVANIKGGKKV